MVRVFVVLDWTQHTLRSNCRITSSLQSQRLQFIMPSPFRLKPFNGSSGCGSSNCTVCIAERFFVQRHFRVMPLQWMNHYSKRAHYACRPCYCTVCAAPARHSPRSDCVAQIGREVVKACESASLRLVSICTPDPTPILIPLPIFVVIPIPILLISLPLIFARCH